ncbi:hypothetical protein QR680_006977 [Steinernema hermaphroditum]|uniref:Globin family profile domain-containing protein n=1 Tax=Steinernema hermaphroditum TaxID=289476 RepID=A0AA39LXE2_9BILA|nr:hypothetical protein QR680_006977 [Steinernema hermaphroditum]
MMRIKEAIMRKKLIQQLNEEFRDEELDVQLDRAVERGKGRLLPTISYAIVANPSQPVDENRSEVTTDSSFISEEDTSNLIGLQQFVNDLNSRLTDLQRRALRVTWKRLSEAPKTSGRGTIQIMEKILEKLHDSDPSMMSIFYKSAFLSCIEDRRKRAGGLGPTIATLRDHANLLIDFVDSVLNVMFDIPLQKPVYDPETIGRIHARLAPLGFDRSIWHKLGECFAEVMFCQEVVRAYPQAASAWSLLAVAFTDKVYSACKVRTALPSPRDQNSASVAEEERPHRKLPVTPSRCPYSYPSFQCARYNYCE